MTNNSASACECKDLSESKPYLLDSDSIFLGTVKSIEKTDDKFTSYFVKFDVDKVWTGSNTKEIAIKASLDSGICGYSFAVNQTLVVHASKENDILNEKGCGTLPVEHVADYIKFLDENAQNIHEDYVKYDFSNKENFALPAFIKKIPLPSDIRQSMLDWCEDSPSSLKNNGRFWDAVPIRILSATAEFQSLHGKTDSFIIHSHAVEESCPPNVWMVGTFASENGDIHKFSLFHDGNFFRYQIGEIQCKDGLVLVTKSTDGSLACVKPETKQKLVERGWAKPTLIENMSNSKYVEMDVAQKLLAQNQIEYNPDKLIVTGGPVTGGDPRCGAVIDVNSMTHWFVIDSISKPQKMTLYSENPHQCQVNTGSCFCNAQMELTALTLEKLSYFTLEEEEKVANMLIDYLGKENINRTPKFLIGKFNLNYTDPSAIGYCGELWGKNTFDYFQGEILDSKVVGFGIGDKLPKLCAINKDAQYFGKVLGEE